MKGFSVFSAFIGTIIFIIAIVVVSLFVQTDLILKKNTQYSESNAQLEGTAGVVNAIFQAKIIEVGEKTVDGILHYENYVPNDPLNEYDFVIVCSDKQSCYDLLIDYIKQKFHQNLQNYVNEISKTIVNILLGEVNADEELDTFKDCFDLELDPKNNMIRVIIKGTANLSINIGGTYRHYSFSVVADDFGSKYDFSVLKDVANAVGTIFENLPSVSAQCMASPICNAICCKSCGKKKKCCYHRTSGCLIWDVVSKSNSFLGEEVSSSTSNLENYVKSLGYDVSYDKDDFENWLDDALNDIYSLYDEVKNNPEQYCGKLSCNGLLGNVDNSKHEEILSNINFTIDYLENIKNQINQEIVCFSSDTIEKNIKHELYQYLKKHYLSFSKLFKLGKICYLDKSLDQSNQQNNNNQNSQQNRNQNNNFYYSNIVGKTGYCPDISYYYNDEYFKEDISNWIKENLNDEILDDFYNNYDKYIEVENETKTGISTYSPKTSCPSCGCASGGSRNNSWSVRELKITLPIRICEIQDSNKCKVLWVKFIYSQP